ncbi:MAG: ISNCY family transposase [Chloroflexi bacterium]|nr:ISNCY family transposase [Chloroflexota bacterium]
MDTRETITLDARARQRHTVLTHLLTGELTLAEAATYLALSERHVRRLVAGLAGQRGAAVLVHGNRGRQPVNRLADDRRARLVELARTTFTGFNAVHLAETLAEEEPALAVSAKTLRRVLAEAGLPLSRSRRSARHRSRRERMRREGMLLQADASRHDWLEGRGPWLTLVGGVDDATSRLTGAVFREQEDAAGYFLMLAQTVRRVGLPLALYTDRHGIFVNGHGRPPTLAEQLTGQRSLTQVGRALDQVGVRWIGARSPQAKGRVERGWGTAQDRLASELRRAHAETIGDANAVLARYLPRYNARFAVPAVIDVPAWRPWPLPWPIEAELCFHYPRRVAADATLAWDGRSLGLPRRRDGRSWARRRVLVEERLDGSLWVRDGTEHHRLTPAPPSAPQLRARPLRQLGELDPLAPVEHRAEPRPPSATTTSKPWRPAPDHPWRR